MAEQIGTIATGDALSGAGRDIVTLRLPAAGAYLSVLRTATASLASRLDFTIDDIEDLRIAVDELCGALVEGSDGSPLLLRFELGINEIDVIGSTGSSGLELLDSQRIDLSRQILQVVVNSHTVEAEDGTMRVELNKRRASLEIDG